MLPENVKNEISIRKITNDFDNFSRDEFEYITSNLINYHIIILKILKIKLKNDDNIRILKIAPSAFASRVYVEYRSDSQYVGENIEINLNDYELIENKK